MKRMLSLLAAALLTLFAGGCSASNQAYYQQAQRFLGAGDYLAAAQLFNQLGGYEDSASYTLYASALHALAQGERQQARATFMLVDPFQHSSRYLTYLDAGDLAGADDLEAAIALYQSLGAFADSAEQVRQLQAELPARDLRRAQLLMHAGSWQQAMELLTPHAGNAQADALLQECRAGLVQSAYDQASALYDRGDYDGALASFEALGDQLDARARALSCRSALYMQAEEAFARVTLSNCEALMAVYAGMDGYLESSKRLDELNDRFAANLLLRDSAGRHPYAVFGSYPVLENGALQPLTWQVLGVTGDEAALLCTQVIDVHTIASATDLALEDATPLHLPDQEQIASLDHPVCSATPYALAQGVREDADGRVRWWLADQRPDQRYDLIWYDGSMPAGGAAADEIAVGLRPVIYLNLNDYSFSTGSGSPEDPFR